MTRSLLALMVMLLPMFTGCGSSTSPAIPFVPAAAAGNLPPTATPDTGAVAIGGSITLTVLANDVDPNLDPLTISKVTQGTLGVVTLNAGSTSLSYQANAGSFGTDIFSYTATDGRGGHVSATVKVVVGGGPVVVPLNPIQRVSNNDLFMADETPEPSSTGQFVAFSSEKNTLVVPDVTAFNDVYVRDTQGGGITRVSLDSTGTQPAGSLVGLVDINRDGTKIAFASSFASFVPGDTNGAQDIFLRDTVAGTTVRVSLDGTGGQILGSTSGGFFTRNGNILVFVSGAPGYIVPDTNGGQRDVFVKELITGAVQIVSVRDNGTQYPANSGFEAASFNGRYVFFSTQFGIDAIDTDGQVDIYVRDTALGTTTLVSQSTGSVAAIGFTPNAAVSGDGDWVAFESDAANLVVGDTNGVRDLFLRRLSTGITTRISLTSTGAQVVSSVVNVEISEDGRFVVGQSVDATIVPGDTNGDSDIFVWDRTNGNVARVNVDANGNQAIGGDSIFPRISSDGKYISFLSDATNLVIGDTNASRDAFLAPNPLAGP